MLASEPLSPSAFRWSYALTGVVLAAFSALGCNQTSRTTGNVQGPVGAFAFGPMAAVAPDGRINLFVVGANRTIWRSECKAVPCDRRSSYDDWWRDAGAPPYGIGSRPSATIWNQNRYDVFVIGARDQHVWHQTRGTTRWLGWEDLGGEVFGAPVATAWSDGRIDLFATFKGENIQQRYCQATGPIACRGASWSAWCAIPGRPPPGFVGDLAAISPTINQIDIAVLGRDGAIWYVSYQNGWGGWQSLGGQFASAPALAGAGGRTDVYALDAQGKLWKTTGMGRTFEQFHAIDARFDEAPVAVASNNRNELFARTRGGETLSHLSCDGDLCVSH
jgi:hypothetical protein